MSIRTACRAGSTGLLTAFMLVVAACDDGEPVDRMRRAQEFLAGDRPSGAIIELKMLLQKSPDNVEGRHLLGTAYVRLARYDDAEKELSRARTLDEHNPSIALDLARVWVRKGAHGKILRDLEILEEWDEADKAAANLLRADAFLARGDIEQAEKTYAKVLSSAPANAAAMIGLTQIALRRGNPARVKETLTRALEIDPKNPRLLRIKAGSAFTVGDFAGAEAGFRTLLNVSPQNVSARLGLVQALLAQGETLAARVELDEALRQSPEYANGHYLRAVMAMQSRDYQGARLSSLRALSRAPDHMPSLYVAGTSNYALGRLREAKWHLETLLRREPDYPTARRLLKVTVQRIADLEASRAKAASSDKRKLADDLRLFRLSQSAFTNMAVTKPTAAAASSPSPSAQSTALETMARSVSALRAGRTDDAVVEFRKAVVHQLHPEATLWLALAHVRGGQPAKAQQTLEIWLLEHTDDLKVRRVLADLYVTRREHEKALPHLKRLSRKSPRDVGILNNLAWVHVHLGAPSEAIPFAERAFALAPADARVMDTLGLALLQSGDEAGAVDVLRRAAGTNLEAADIQLHLAQALIENGEEEEAGTVLRVLLALDQAKSVHRAAEALLRSIEQ